MGLIERIRLNKQIKYYRKKAHLDFWRNLLRENYPELFKDQKPMKPRTIKILEIFRKVDYMGTNSREKINEWMEEIKQLLEIWI